MLSNLRLRACTVITRGSGNSWVYSGLLKKRFLQNRIRKERNPSVMLGILLPTHLCQNPQSSLSAGPLISNLCTCSDNALHHTSFLLSLRLALMSLRLDLHFLVSAVLQSCWRTEQKLWVLESRRLLCHYHRLSLWRNPRLAEASGG